MYDFHYNTKKEGRVSREANPLVSVVIPTYNRAELVCNAIESALNQIYKNIEIIVIDDGSTDDTAKRVGQYATFVKYYYQANKGASAAQNRGIVLSRGEWVAILASDDLWLPEKILLQVEAIKEFGPEYGLCFTDCHFITESSNNETAFQKIKYDFSYLYGCLDNPLDLLLGYQPLVYMQSALVRRELLIELGGFDEELFVAEDTDLIFRLSLKTKFCYVNKPLVIIDRRASNKDKRLSSFIERKDATAIESIEKMYLKWLKLLRRNEYEFLRIRILDYLIIFYLNHLILMIKRLNFCRALVIIRKLIILSLNASKIFSLIISNIFNKVNIIIKKIIKG